MSTPIEIPDALRRKYRTSVDGREWLGRLPRFIQDMLWTWDLLVDLPDGAMPWHGNSAIVIPVVTRTDIPAALKISFPHDEALTEPMALRLWNGHGAVRLLQNDESSGAMLLERLDNTRTLQALPMEESMARWGGVLRQLGIRAEAGPGWERMPRIAATAERYCDELPQRWSDMNEPFERWLLEAALEVCQTHGAVAPQSNASDVLVHTDLHFMNILARPALGANTHPSTGLNNASVQEATDYVAIDPQAQVGHAEFALAPCLWNRLHELPERNSEAALRRRARYMARSAGLDEGLAVEWAIVREVENALSYFEAYSHGDAQRSLWVASTLAGKTLPGLPDVHSLPELA